MSACTWGMQVKLTINVGLSIPPVVPRSHLVDASIGRCDVPAQVSDSLLCVLAVPGGMPVAMHEDYSLRHDHMALQSTAACCADRTEHSSKSWFRGNVLVCILFCGSCHFPT